MREQTLRALVGALRALDEVAERQGQPRRVRDAIVGAVIEVEREANLAAVSAMRRG